MVDWVLDAVAEAGATDIKVIVSPHHAEVAAHLDARRRGRLPARAARARAHALKQVPAHELEKGDVLVVNGDSPLLTADTISKVVEEHRGSGAPATIASVEDQRRDDGRIIRDKDGSFERIVERKDATPRCSRRCHEFNVGLYCFEGEPLVEALAKIKNDNERRRVLPAPTSSSTSSPSWSSSSTTPTRRLGVKDRATLASATAALPPRILRPAHAGGRHHRRPREHLHRRRRSTIGQDTVIEPFTVIKGQPAIGAECRIGPHVHIEDARIGDRSDCGPFAKLRPGTVIGDDVHIGSFAELVRTKVGRGSKVPHVSYLGDTDLGEDANIGAGTITANFDGDEQEPHRDRRRRVRRGGHDAGRARQTWQGVADRRRIGGDQGRPRRRDSGRSSS